MPNVVWGVMLGIASLTPTYESVGVPRAPAPHPNLLPKGEKGRMKNAALGANASQLS